MIFQTWCAQYGSIFNLIGNSAVIPEAMPLSDAVGLPGQVHKQGLQPDHGEQRVRLGHYEF